MKMTSSYNFRVSVWCSAGYPVVVLVLLGLDGGDEFVQVQYDIVISLGHVLDTAAVEVGPHVA